MTGLVVTGVVALAGGAGAVARFAVDDALQTQWGDRFPWTTLFINVTGSFLLGALVGLVARGAPDSMVTIGGVGFCGGYTTFSTACVASVALLRQGRLIAALANAVGSLAATVPAAWLGLTLTASWN